MSCWLGRRRSRRCRSAPGTRRVRRPARCPARPPRDCRPHARHPLRCGAVVLAKRGKDRSHGEQPLPWLSPSAPSFVAVRRLSVEKHLRDGASASELEKSSVVRAAAGQKLRMRVTPGSPRRIPAIRRHAAPSDARILFRRGGIHGFLQSRSSASSASFLLVAELHVRLLRVPAVVLRARARDLAARARTEASTSAPGAARRWRRTRHGLSRRRAISQDPGKNAVGSVRAVAGESGYRGRPRRAAEGSTCRDGSRVRRCARRSRERRASARHWRVARRPTVGISTSLLPLQPPTPSCD